MLFGSILLPGYCKQGKLKLNVALYYAIMAMLHFETTDTTSGLTHFQQIQRIKVILTLEPELRKTQQTPAPADKKGRSSGRTPASGTPVHSTT